MAFYTELDQQELLAMLRDYGIDALTACTGASDGIENTTYFLESDAQKWILTLFEEISADELPFFVRLMDWLYARQLPVAHALADNNAKTLHTLSNKPALLFPRLSGQHPRNMTIEQCRAIGYFLGHMHAVSQNYPEQRDNQRGHRSTPFCCSRAGARATTWARPCWYATLTVWPRSGSCWPNAARSWRTMLFRPSPW